MTTFETSILKKKIWHGDLTWGIATLGALMVLYSRVDANAQAKVDALERRTLAAHESLNQKVDAILIGLHIPIPEGKDGGK